AHRLPPACLRQPHGEFLHVGGRGPASGRLREPLPGVVEAAQLRQRRALLPVPTVTVKRCLRRAGPCRATIGTDRTGWVRLALPCGSRCRGFEPRHPPHLLRPAILAASCVRRVVDGVNYRSEEHTSELQSRFDLVCRLL